MSEDAPILEVFYTVQAEDADENTVIQYSLAEQSPVNFGIDQAGGVFPTVDVSSVSMCSFTERYTIGNIGRNASMSMLTLFEIRRNALKSMPSLFESRYTLKGRYNIGNVEKLLL